MTFLATTALRDFWREDEEILFLGSWCTSPHPAESLLRLRSTVLPSPWNDRDRFYRAAAYLDELYERVLPQLADRFNALHGIKRSVRFWRILAGPWLLHAIHTLYDRYILLSEALNWGAETTIGLDRSCYRTPSTTLEHLEWLWTDAYNLQLFTEILEGLGHVVPRRELSPDPETVGKRNTGIKSILRSARDLVSRTAGRAVLPLAKTALYEAYAGRGPLWNLALRSRFRIVPQEIRDVFQPVAINQDLRRSMKIDPTGNEFEDLLGSLLPGFAPSAFVESYDDLARTTRPTAASIASAVGWYFNERVKFTAATLAERGARVYAIQHGGGYGVYRNSPAEKHERKLADQFFVWGWADQEPAVLRNLPSPRLHFIRDRSTRALRNSLVLFVPTTHPAYLYRFHSSPVGSQWDEYYDWQDRFLAALPPAVVTETVYKSMSLPRAQHAFRMLARKHTALRAGESGLASSFLGQSRIVVVDHCATTMLESLAEDVPTVLFWQRDRWETRPEAEVDFEKLRRAKILFDDPESAAEHVRAQYDDPTDWWRAAQEARLSFVRRYALSTTDWKRAWICALTNNSQSVAETLERPSL